MVEERKHKSSKLEDMDPETREEKALSRITRIIKTLEPGSRVRVLQYLSARTWSVPDAEKGLDLM